MKRKIALVVSTPTSFNVFYKKHIEYLKREYNVTLIANFSLDECVVKDIRCIDIPIQRKPAFLKDLITLFMLIKIFKKENFDVVHSTTPKAGLLGQLAAYFSGIEVRLHTFTGQVWANKFGYKREILKFIDRIIAYLPTNLLADSWSQKKVLEDEKITSKGKVEVLGLGSISGVDLNRFTPLSSDNNLKKELNLPEDSFLYLYLGRLNKDKGILDLLHAFGIVAKSNKNAVLLVVGRDEENLLPIIEGHELFGKSIFYQGFTTSPQDYMAIADVFCLPSYREGFGSVIIEASACGTPSIGTNIYGLSDAIENNKSGLLCEVANPQDLAKKMHILISNRKLLKEFSDYGILRVKDHFDDNVSSRALVSYYEKILKVE